MTYVLIYLFAVVVWLTVAWSFRTRVAYEARLSGQEADTPSWLPFLVAPPVLLTALAYAVDRSRAPMGTWVVTGALAIVGLFSLALGLRGRSQLRRRVP